MNTGDSIAKEGSKERQSIYNGLPLRGGERLSMKILDQGKALTVERIKLDLILLIQKKI